MSDWKNPPPPAGADEAEWGRWLDQGNAGAGRLMAEAALIREESRGAHYRTDYPVPREGWRRHIVFRRG